jgi:hypothetical protein
MGLNAKIRALLKVETGVTAREIAHCLKLDKSEVNSCLYSLKSQGLAHHRINSDISNTRPLWFSGPLESRIASASGQSSGVSHPADSARDSAVQYSLGKANPRYVPTAEQQSVIEAKTNSRLYIQAGPGTGKSETLVARLKHLLGPGGLGPAQVLVLSFSVAAIKEIKARIERQSDDHSALLFVEIRTFDSYASRFLRKLLPASDLHKLSYDERILRATDEIRNNVHEAQRLAGLKHVFLDEMQDLVGVRADFALTLLEAVKPNFTLFGDAAQGIYDFTIENGPSKTTSSGLLKAIRATFPDLDESHRFTKNHRAAGNSQLESIASTGRALLLRSTNKAREFLEKEFNTLCKQGSTRMPQIDASLLNESTCVVCRTSGQVFRLAGQLLEKRIPFQIARDKNEFLPPAWIGRVFLGWQTDPVCKAPFIARSRNVLLLSDAAALSLWSSLLAAIAPRKSLSFSLSDLRAAITDGVPLPENPIYTPIPQGINLSTIHRSKGREFNNVIVVMNDADDRNAVHRGEDRIDDSSEPRVLFVALTRARDSLHRMEARAKGIWRQDERWIRTFPNANGFIRLFSIQVGHGRDVDHNSFAMGGTGDVMDRQKFLAETAFPGTPVELCLDDALGRYPRYKLMLSGVHVGNMSQHFGKSIFYTLTTLNGFEPNRFPKRITGLWVKEVVTAVGDLAADTVDDSLRTSGLWMSLALEGLGNTEWK